MKCELSLICGYVNETIATSELSKFNYISTENMLPNKNGIEPASSLPNQKVVKAFKKGDILISNIRPYFKKIWLAEYNGGCSNDVLVIRAKKGTNKEFLYYLLSLAISSTSAPSEALKFLFFKLMTSDNRSPQHKDIRMIIGSMARMCGTVLLPPEG